MTRSIEEIVVKKSIHSNSTPVIISSYRNVNESPERDESERDRRQQELLDSLAQQHIAERIAVGASSRGSTLGGRGAFGGQTMSMRSNYSEFMMNGSGLADQSYSLDFSAQHTTNPSYSSYGGVAGDIDLPYEQQMLRAQEQMYREERRTITATTNTTTTNNFYQDVITIDEPPIYMQSSGRGNKSASNSYNSYKSIKSRNILPPVNCDIKPVWVLTKVTRYVTRTVRREKVSPQ